jgi:hypothetical protein
MEVEVNGTMNIVNNPFQGKHIFWMGTDNKFAMVHQAINTYNKFATLTYSNIYYSFLEMRISSFNQR